MKGATLSQHVNGHKLQISIHAPVKGATGPVAGRGFRLKYFNPRSREGSDSLPLSDTPARSNFNPRSREGSDTDSDTER